MTTDTQQDQNTQAANGEGQNQQPSDATGAAHPERSSQADAATRPDGLPEAYWNADDGAVRLDDLVKDYQTLADEKKARDDARAALPQKPDDYEVALPEDFELPEGEQFMADHPLVADAVKEFRQLAHEMGMSQEQFSKSLGVFARQKIAEEAYFQGRHAEEIKSLGPNSGQRVDDLNRFFDKMFGQETAAAFKNMLFTKTLIEGFETFKEALGKSMPNPALGGERKTSEPSDEEWDRMSPADQISHNYAIRQNGQMTR